MLLAADIGNSNIKFGVFEGDRLVSKFSVPTGSFLSANNLDTLTIGLDKNIDQAIACSVVPDVDPLVREFISSKLGLDVRFVTNDTDLGLDVRYDPLSSAGTDRLVNSFSAAERYGVPCIVCSFGTATTFDVVDSKRTLLGGVITAGMETTAKALHLNTAKLPEVEIKQPEGVIGTNTDDAIGSGLVYGHVAMAEGMITRLKKAAGEDCKVVATGGFAKLIAENTDVIDTVDADLLLEGLALIHRRSYPA